MKPQKLIPQVLCVIVINSLFFTKLMAKQSKKQADLKISKIWAEPLNESNPQLIWNIKVENVGNATAKIANNYSCINHVSVEAFLSKECGIESENAGKSMISNCNKKAKLEPNEFLIFQFQTQITNSDLPFLWIRFNEATLSKKNDNNIENNSLCIQNPLLNEQNISWQNSEKTYIENEICPEEDLQFLAQVEIDNFAINYPNCKNFEGNIKIGNIIPNNNSIFNVDALANLESIDGYLFIAHNSELQNLNGLANLQEIKGDLFIGGNSKLSNIAEQLSLQEVQGNLIIESNTQIIHLNCLQNLELIQGNCIINNNQILTDICGLSNVHTITGDTIISNNPNLTNLDCFTEQISTNTIIDLVEKDKLTVYPNPTNKLINVSFSENLSNQFNYTISDIQGKLIAKDSFTLSNFNTYTIDISKLNKGLYLLNVCSNGIAEDASFIVK